MNRTMGYQQKHSEVRNTANASSDFVVGIEKNNATSSVDSTINKSL